MFISSLPSIALLEQLSLAVDVVDVCCADVEASLAVSAAAFRPSPSVTIIVSSLFDSESASEMRKLYLVEEPVRIFDGQLTHITAEFLDFGNQNIGRS